MPFVKTNDINLYYELTDFTRPWNGDPETLILLHGLHGSIRWWNYYQVAPLSQFYRVITVDLRGHGRSDKPAEGYSIEQMASDLHGLLKKLGLTQVHIGGASMGGMVALQFALTHPEMVQSLILVDSFPNTPDALKGALETWIKDTEDRGYARVMETFNEDNADALFSASFREKFPRFLDFDTEEVLKNLMPDPAFIGCCRAIQDFDVLGRLTEIPAPVFLVTSDEGIGYEAAQKMKSLLPNADLWAPGGVGHSVHIEIPDEFNRKVLAFLQGVRNQDLTAL